MDSSARNAFKPDMSPLMRFSPFLALQLDVEDRRRMQVSESRKKELYKRMSDSTKPKEMAIFGRPLWYAYIDKPQEMYEVAKLKHVGGKQLSKYNPVNE